MGGGGNVLGIRELFFNLEQHFLSWRWCAWRIKFMKPFFIIFSVKEKPIITHCPFFNLDPRCLEDLKPGNCVEYVVRWYYDQQVNSCARFWFSGCNGSGNRFNSEKECQEICIQS